LHTSAKKSKEKTFSKFLGKTYIAKTYYLYCTGYPLKELTGLIERSQSTGGGGANDKSYMYMVYREDSVGDFPSQIVAVISARRNLSRVSANSY